MESNFPPSSPKNSRREEPEKPKVEKVVTGNVTQRKKSVGRRLSAFIFGDGSRNVVRHVLEDVLLPAAKDTLVDAITQGVETRVFGTDTRRHSRSRSTGNSRESFVSYNRYANDRNSSRREDPRPTMSVKGRRNHDFDEIELDSRVEANEIIENMYTLLEKYQSVSVHDLYVMLGVVPDFTDEKWGWEDLRGSGIRRTRSGRYVLNLPSPEPIV